MMVGDTQSGDRAGRALRSAAVSMMAVAGMGLAGPAAQAAPAQDLPTELTRVADGNSGATCCVVPPPDGETPPDGEPGGDGKDKDDRKKKDGQTEKHGQKEKDGADWCEGGGPHHDDVWHGLLGSISDRNVKTDVTPVDWSR